MLENIIIIDYKCFKNFQLDGIKRINIISGENNVGKTALLEAMFIESYINHSEYFGISVINPFALIAKNRDTSNTALINYMANIKFESVSNTKQIKVESKYSFQLNEDEKILLQNFKEDYSIFLSCHYNSQFFLLPIKKDELNDIYVPLNYINSSKPTNQNLVNLYSFVQSKGIQHKFLNYLKILDKNIEWIEPQLINEELLLRINLNNPEHSLISSELGEGVNRYIEILATLLSNSGGNVFIDEIENGLHYLKLLDIAKAIIEIAEKEDIQVFITTHDRDTIEAFANASKEVGFTDISSIKLIKDEDNKIVPIVRGYDNFAYGIDRGADMR